MSLFYAIPQTTDVTVGEPIGTDCLGAKGGFCIAEVDSLAIVDKPVERRAVCYTFPMPPESLFATAPDAPRPAATLHDQPRHDATGPDHDYTLTIDEACDRYAAAGHPRTLRTVQRYCARGHIDARKVMTMSGEKYLVAPYSVSRHIAQINEAVAFSGQTTERDETRLDATAHDRPRLPVTAHDQPINPEPAGKPPVDNRYVELLESENTFLREQVKVKDGQIGELTERARETNFLIQGLQNLFLALQPGRPGPEKSQAINPTSTSDQPAT
jgi:hypothetical protein